MKRRENAIAGHEPSQSFNNIVEIYYYPCIVVVVVIGSKVRHSNDHVFYLKLKNINQKKELHRSYSSYRAE
jgi:hypothetical protein